MHVDSLRATHPRRSARLLSGDLARAHQVSTVAHFRDIDDARDGVLAISSETGTTVHTPSCQYVTEPNFVTKVITNHGRNGRYWWFASIAAAASALGPDLRLCSRCVTAEFADRDRQLADTGSA